MKEVVATVQNIIGNGIVVNLHDTGAMGYIPQRELSWERRIGKIPPLPAIGSEVEAVIVEHNPESKFVTLSIKQKTDPWLALRKGKYWIGQVVRCEIVNVREVGVFVQIEPGIDALIRIEDLPTLDEEKTDSILAVGDQLEAEIIYIDFQKHEIDASLLKRIQALSFDYANNELSNLSALQNNKQGLFKSRFVTEYNTTNPTSTNDENLISQLGMQVFASLSIRDRLQRILSSIVKSTSITHAVVLEVDMIKREVKLVSAFSEFWQTDNWVNTDGLFYSPVLGIVQNHRKFIRENLSDAKRKKIPNFFHDLQFRACYGTPLTIPGLPTRHVLLLFKNEGGRFISHDIGRAGLAALILQVALERQQILEFMQRFSQRYVMGELLGSFAHEVSNKVDTLQSRTRVLKHDLDVFSSLDDLLSNDKKINKAQTATKQISEIGSQLEKLTNAYLRISSDEYQLINVNEILQSMQNQFAMLANEAETELHIFKAEETFFVYAVEVHLSQILTNLILNAIQQVKTFKNKIIAIAKSRGLKNLTFFKGHIAIKAEVNRESNLVNISVIDNGPGIHFHKLDEIFLLDTSEREDGHGLGLYISNNLAETMGGRLYLADSVMFVGSRFVVELPLTNPR